MFNIRNNGGSISREMSVPAKLIINGGKEIDVWVTMIDECTTEETYYYNKETTKFAGATLRITRTYTCEEYLDECANFL